MYKEEINNLVTAGTGSRTKALKAQQQNFMAEDNGSISGYFATFDHDHGDSYGDVIAKGAFLGTIARRKQTGHPFPLCFNHDFGCVIGRVTDIGEDARGAYFTAKFFPTEKAQEIRNIVKSGVLWQFSFAYDTLDQGKVTAGDGTTVNELRELELYEISIVTVPANQRAVLTDIKTDNSVGEKLSPERREAREEVLRYIAQMEEKRQSDRNRLLAFIKEMNEKNTDVRLRQLEEMEAQALKDIGQAEAEGLEEWKLARLSALDAIRKEIKRLKDPNRGKTGKVSIKTVDCPGTVK